MVTVDKIAYEKTLLRREMFIIRRRIKNRRKRIESLMELLISHPQFRSADKISIYLSMRDEIPTQLAINAAWEQGKTVYIPMSGDDDRLALKRYLPGDALWPNAWGVPEPVTNEFFPIEKVNLDLIIMPGLAFTPKGDRLGYGKGYYDRFMEKHPEVYTIGLCYQEQIREYIPTNEKDYPVDTVLVA